MQFLAYVRIISILLAIIATTFLLPIGVALHQSEYGVISAFAIPMIFCWIIGLIVFVTTRDKKIKLSTSSGFLIVALCWVFGSFIGASPFVISGVIPNIVDAIFESASGFTTTGATILTEVESLPRSMNLWRTQMHWLGGLGIVSLTVALMPILGIGGFQLIKSETTGPEKGKVTPKIATTAKYLWLIYTGLTVIQTILLLIAGLDFIDSISHTFATLGTGGFSTKNLSVGGYNSAAVEIICTVFMFLAGVNFNLYFLLLTGKAREVFLNSEFKAYVSILVIAIMLMAINLLPLYENIFTAMRYASFQAVSITTTTGFTSADYELWPAFSQIVLFILMFVGGCSGSTGGSIKVIRWVVLGKQTKNEMQRLLHPHAVYGIRLNSRAGRKDIVFNVSAFIFVYFMVVGITALVASTGGADVLTSFTSSLAIVGNIGPGFGAVGAIDNYAFFSPFAKAWFSFAMIAGRLEIYTMVLFLFPSFWKK